LCLAGILKDQLAVLRITTFFVTLQTPDRTDLGPDFLGEVIVHVPIASYSSVWFCVLAARSGGKAQERDENKR
jgi:hypothetical protein